MQSNVIKILLYRTGYERVTMLFTGYLPTFTASILEPLLDRHTTSYMYLILRAITAILERNALIDVL